jgi:exopolyphosphatase/guanosine-5'-triphosphate,3'-diphosphate pyrophosphatase
MTWICEDVDAERAPVFPAGLAILLEIVENFGIDRVRVAEGAMREGLLYDLMGRFTDEDARVRSVRAMEKRYHVDALQADRVEATAVALLAQVESEWGLEDPLAESDAALGGAAARDRARHRALQVPSPQRISPAACGHAGVPARGTAAFVRAGRRAPAPAFLRFIGTSAAAVGQACRISHRAVASGGAAASRPQPAAAARGAARSEGTHHESGAAAESWMKEHPLTLEDLEQERAYLKDAGFRLSLSRAASEAMLKTP